MDSIRETIDEIVSVSQRLINALAVHLGHNGETVEISRIQLAGDLHKIVATSLAIVESLKKSSDYRDRTLDERMTDWLLSQEPVACKKILNMMANLARVDEDKRVWKWLPMLPFGPTEGRVRDAITLFADHRDHFHFLLTTDVWNHEKHARPGLGASMQVGSINPAKEISTSVDTVMRDVAGAANEKRKRVDRDQLEDILQWIDGLDCTEKHETMIDLRQSDTCMWLPDTYAYKTWRHGDDTFLWLHGKPGAGKSVLTAFVIEGLERSLEDGEVLAFFYCDFRSERSMDAAEVMRSLLSQLLHNFRDDANDPGNVLEDLIKEKRRSRAILSSSKRLARQVSNAVKRFTRLPLIVIDALDECRDIQNLLDALVVLSQARLRLFTTSRPLQLIKDRFLSLPSLSLEKMSSAVSADIQLHVTRELDSDRRLRIASPRLKEEIRYALCENADGMFRWIQCQLESLKRCMTPMDIREVLESLPRGLEETYERILLAIDKEEREAEVARRALTWLVATFSPLRLSQIVEALSIDLYRRILDPEFAPVHGLALLDALSSLVTYDEETDVVILSHFSVQEYLTEELLHARLSAYHIDLPYAEGQLAQFCMCYIAACLKQGQGFGMDVSSSHTAHGSRINTNHEELSHAVMRHAANGPSSESRPLLEYVLSHTFDHLAHVNPGNKVVLKALVALEMDVQRNPSAWDQMRTERTSFPAWPTSRDDIVLYILIAFASEPLLCTYLGRGPVKPKAGTNPLVYAAQLNKIVHARTLLSRGVTSNLNGLLALRASQITPLEAAVRHRSTAAVDLFLMRGSSVPRKVFKSVLKVDYWESGAGMHVLAKLLQTDDFVEWVAEIQDGFLLLSSLGDVEYTDNVVEQMPEDEDVVSVLRRLVQIGCELPADSSNAQNLFHRATAAGYISTIKYMLSLNVPPPPDILLIPRTFVKHLPSLPVTRLLLNSGADIHAVTDDEGNNALHVAIGSTDSDVSEGDCLERVKLLADAGCDPSTCNLLGITPLQVAVSRGFIDVIQYLLSLGVPQPRNILLSVWRMPLKAPMLRYLIRTGADVFTVAEDGDTMLHIILDCSTKGHQGAEEDCLESAKILIDARCSPCITNSVGDTPMDVAVQTGHVSVVEYFLALNVPLPSNALLKASRVRELSPNSLQMTRMLIEKRLDIGVTSSDSDGNNALHLALISANLLKRHLEDTVKILVKAGCDVNACNAAGQTPMHLAARYKHKPIIKYFLSQGASLPRDILLSVTSSELVTFFVEQGADLCVVAKNGNTVLHHIMNIIFPEDDTLVLTKVLTRARCNLHIPNSIGETPLQIAARRGYVSIVEYLLSINVPLPPDILVTAWRSPSMTRDHSRLQTIRFLVEKGAATNVVTGNGDNALHLALSSNFVIQDDALKAAKVLIDARCESRAQNLAGETALHAAAKGGNLSCMEYLISQGVPFNANILLAQATAGWPHKKATIMRFLIDKGADVRAVTSKGDTALHLTLACGFEPTRLETAQILVDSGCDPSWPNLAGETPLHVAARSGFPPLVKYLRSLQVALPPDILLAAAAALGKVYPPRQDPHVTPTFRLLIREGASVNVVAPNGDTLLHIVIRQGVRSRSPRAKIRGTVPWSLVGVLLSAGCDPFVRNAEGKTVFDLVEERGPFAYHNFLRLVGAFRVSDQRRPPPPSLDASSLKRRAEGVDWEIGGLTKRGRLDDIGDEDEIAEVDEQLIA